MSSRSCGSNQRGKRGPAKTSGSTKRGRGADDEGWGGFKNYMAAKKFKLGEQFDVEYKERQSGIFQGVAIYINGYTKPSSDELRRLITAHGGKYHMYLSKTKVTHIIATNLPNSKFHLAKTMPVVKPEWITESVAAGKCLPHTSYLTIDNKSKLQAGLKSFPYVSSLSRNCSTSTLSRENSTGSNSSLNNHAPMSCNNLIAMDDIKNQEGDNSLNENMFIPGQVSNLHKSSSLIKDVCMLEKKKLDSQNKRIIDDLENDKDIDSGSDFETDIVYNSEDEEMPLRLKQNFSKLLTTPRLSNSPNRLPMFHIGRNNSSTPQLKIHASSSEDLNETSNSEHQSSTEVKSTNIPFTAISPILEEDEPSNKEILKSIPENAILTNPSPSKSASSFKSSMPKAGDKGFLNEYYSNSRLHHISTWGAEFKAYVADIQQKGDVSFPGRDQLRQVLVENATRLGMTEPLESPSCGSIEKTVMHIDMDCFFVSVGLLSRPDLKGKPVAVTHSKGQDVKPDPKADAELEKLLWHLKKDKGLKNAQGSSNEKPARNEYDFAVPEGSTGVQTFHSMAEIASCSYEARQKGVKNGMFMGKAKTLCPDLKTIPYDFDGYNRVSRILYDLVASFTHDIEAVSCDEMFVDCTDILSDTGASAVELARLLRKEVFDKTGCTASVGIGPNILLARLATKRAKPNGIFQVFKHEAKAFIKDQKVSDLPGVGYSMSNKLARLGITTCGELQSIPESTLRREFGPKTGDSLHRCSLGIDDREVKGNKQRKSVSAEVNYGIRFTQESDAVKFLKELSEEVAKRLDSLRVKGRSITLKLMVKRPDAPMESAKFMGHGLCNTVTKSTILPVATGDGNQIGHEVVSMYKHHKIPAHDVRGIGIQVHKLEGTGGGDQHSNNNVGHQSILQFAISRKPPTHTNTGTVLQSKESEINVKGGPGDERGKKDKIDLERKFVNPSIIQRIQTGSDVSTMRDVSFLLSPSQVSESVLDELPSDIASEIRNGIEQHKKRKTDPSNPVTSTSVDEAASRPSTSSNQNDEIATHVDDLPSESQLDMSCFHALPRSLQKELEEAYAKQRLANNVEDKRSSPIKGTALEKLKSPTKDKGKKLKKRRGRPPGSKKRLHIENVPKLKSIGKKGGQDGERIHSKTDIKFDVNGVICLDDDVDGDDGCDSRDTLNSHNQDIPEPTRFVSQPKVEFCGATSLRDVRSLFKEWMETCAEPGDSDVAMVTDYLTSLVHHKCLEHVFCLLRFLMRYVQLSSQSAMWRQCAEMITALVQSVVMDLHGAELKMI